MLKGLWKAWKRLARQIGDLQARVLLTILYGFFVLPFGLVVRLWADPLRIKKRPVAWLEHASDPDDVAWARRQW